MVSNRTEGLSSLKLPFQSPMTPFSVYIHCVLVRLIYQSLYTCQCFHAFQAQEVLCLECSPATLNLVCFKASFISSLKPQAKLGTSPSVQLILLLINYIYIFWHSIHQILSEELESIMFLLISACSLNCSQCLLNECKHALLNAYTLILT